MHPGGAWPAGRPRQDPTHEQPQRTLWGQVTRKGAPPLWRHSLYLSEVQSAPQVHFQGECVAQTWGPWTRSICTTGN